MNKRQSNLEYKKGVYGKNYANLRKKEYNGKKDYTVRELGEKLFISASTISAIEKESRLPTIEQVLAYKHLFRVSLDYLTGETDVLSADLQYVCKYTGLSEKAITNISMDNPINEINRHRIISFLENNAFIEFIDVFQDYLDEYVYDTSRKEDIEEINNKIEEIEDLLSNPPEDDVIIDDRKALKKQLKKLQDEHDFYYWKMEHSIKDFIKALIEEYEQ